MGTMHFWYDFDQVAAEKEFQRAIELNPSYDDAHDFYGVQGVADLPITFQREQRSGNL
jgi:hypothetical protein